jgi:large subunit ribosomal protein L21
MSEFAVIKTGGKQYLVKPGQKLRIEKISKPEHGNMVNFNQVLLVGSTNQAEFGTPQIPGARVQADWLSEGKGKKISIFRYHSKTRYRKKKGHRQPFTEVLIKEIFAK